MFSRLELEGTPSGLGVKLPHPTGEGIKAGWGVTAGAGAQDALCNTSTQEVLHSAKCQSSSSHL